MRYRESATDVLNLTVCLLIGWFAYRQAVASLTTREQSSAVIAGAIEKTRGTVQMRRSRFETWGQASEKMDVTDGMSIFTQKNSSIDFQLRDSKIELNAETLIQVIDPVHASEFRLSYGNISFSGDESQISVHTGRERFQIELRGAKASLKRDASGRTLLTSVSGKVHFRLGGIDRVLKQGESAEFRLPEGGIAQAEPATPQKLVDPVSPLVPFAIRKPAQVEPRYLVHEIKPPLPTTLAPIEQKPIHSSDDLVNSFETGIGPTYLQMSRAASTASAKLTGLSGPSFNLKTQYALNPTLAVAFAFGEQSFTARGQFSFLQQESRFKLRQKSVKLRSKIAAPITLDFGVSQEDSAHLVLSSDTLKVVTAETVSAVLGARYSFEMFSARAFIQPEILIPIMVPVPSGVTAFQSNPALQAEVGIESCLSQSLSITATTQISQRSGSFRDETGDVKSSQLSVFPFLGLRAGECHFPRNFNK